MKSADKSAHSKRFARFDRDQRVERIAGPLRTASRATSHEMMLVLYVTVGGIVSPTDERCQ